MLALSRPRSLKASLLRCRAAFSTDHPAAAAAAAAGNRPLSDMLRDLKASEHFDLIVIGSGPAGQKCAIDSAKSGLSVAVIDKRDMHGGVCVHTGTVPSKVRERTYGRRLSNH